jgi:cytochrome c2
LFRQFCVACHTIGQGKLIGPDLIDVHNRRSEAGLSNLCVPRKQ